MAAKCAILAGSLTAAVVGIAFVRIAYGVRGKRSSRIDDADDADELDEASMT
jgi:NhaA family Na+:H+ antiporter